MSSLTKIFKAINKVAEATQTPVYIVGGFVRDLLMEKEESTDLDFVVVGSGLAFAREFDKHMNEGGLPAGRQGRLIEFPNFDTARYLVPISETENLELEFAGARSETYDPASRKPQVTQATLLADLSRRDFTVNAMALPVSAWKGAKAPSLPSLKKQIIDLFNGQKDLKDKTLRTPLEPNLTFSDDPLRLLRAVRFASQLNFALAPETMEAIHKNRARLKIVSAERLQEELVKLMETSQPSVGLALMFQTHLLDVILPEVSALDGIEEIFGHQHKNNLIHSFKVVDNIAEQSDNVWLRLAGLFHDIGKPGTKHFVPKTGFTFHAHEHLSKKLFFSIAKRFRFSTDNTKYVAKLIRWHMQPIALMDEGITDSAVRRLVVTLGPELDDLLILGRSDITTGNPFKKDKRLKNYDHLKAKIIELLEKDKLRAFQSPFRGDEIMQLTNLKPGPTVGKIKDAIEEAILEGIIPNDYQAAKDYFENIKDEYVAQAQKWELK